MLIEAKVKVSRIIDDKTRKKTETYITDTLVFAEAECQVMGLLVQDQEAGLVRDYEIQSLRISPIKEICTQWLEDYTVSGYPSFIATLKDIFHTDDGTEKILRYKVLLWAENHSQALTRVQQLARQGYDLQIEGIKQVDYEYLNLEENNEQDSTV